ncbi:MAG TPA: hypothetical protein VFA20_34300 [Myxococcaceae bacterium]|nr:hypothetical protein [Myxococcaceae bacterium]
MDDERGGVIAGRDTDAGLPRVGVAAGEDLGVYGCVGLAVVLPSGDTRPYSWTAHGCPSTSSVSEVIRIHGSSFADGVNRNFATPARIGLVQVPQPVNAVAMPASSSTSAKVPALVGRGTAAVTLNVAAPADVLDAQGRHLALRDRLRRVDQEPMASLPPNNR